MNKPSPTLLFALLDHAPTAVGNHTHTLKDIRRTGITHDIFVGADRINDAGDPFGITAFEKIRAPDLASVLPITFEQATDITAMKLAALMEKSDLPIAVHWSGGIDSTAVLAGMMKNFNPVLRNRVVVVMNNTSYWDNPHFFEKIIKPNFRYTSDQTYNWDNAIIINGDPGDKLWIANKLVQMEQEHKNTFDRSLSKPDMLIEWMSNQSRHSHDSNKDYAQWLLEHVQHSAKKAQVVLENYSDFYWWLQFAFVFQGAALTSFRHVYNGSSTHWENYNKNFFIWWTTDEYQKWSVYAQQTQEKFKGSVTSYKMTAKNYIFDVDKNDWYKTYKTKSDSVKWSRNLMHASTLIYSDGTISHAPSSLSELNLKHSSNLKKF